jgi:tetratricopeptide (TPR) repeat protein
MMTSTTIKAVGCAVIITLLMSGCNRSPEARRDKHLVKGKAFFQKRDYSRAILEFKNAIHAMPKDAEAYYQLGLASLAARDLGSAVGSLKTAVQLNPKHAGAELALAQMMANASDRAWVQKAEDRLKALLLTGSTPEALNTLAIAEMNLGKAESAVGTLEQALLKAPEELTSFLLLARARVLQRDFTRAEEVLKKACTVVARKTDARLALGKFYRAQNRLTDAEAEFRTALTLDPNSGEASVELAKVQAALGKGHEAEENLKRLSAGSDRRYASVYAAFLFSTGKRTEAIRELQRLVSEYPEDRVLRAQLMTAHRATNNTAEVERIVNTALTKNGNDIEALLWRAALLLQSRNLSAAERDLNHVLAVDRTSAEAHYLLAKLHQARGATHLCRQYLTESLRWNPFLLTVRLELSQLLLTSNAAQAALDVLNSAPDAQKALSSVTVQKNWALWAVNDMKAMRRGIDAGLARERSADLLIQDGVWNLRAGNPTRARAVLDEALKINPGDVTALAALSEAYRAQKLGQVALQKVKEYAAQQPRSAPVQLFLGKMLMASGDRGQARAAFTAAKAADEGLVEADLSLVQLEVLENRFADAAKRLKNVLSHPSNDDARQTTARLWLGEVEAIIGNYDAALDEFRKVVDKQPNNADALNNFAYLLSEHKKNPDEALKHAQRAQELAPDDPEVADTLGWVLYQKRVYPLAVKQFQRAVARGDKPTWQYHLAMAYAKTGEVARARETLSRAVRAAPNAPEAKIAAALISASH